jgi:hypothetical protein
MLTNEVAEPSGLRGILNKNPVLTYGLIGLLVVVAAYFLLMGNREAVQQSYYTTDLGATFFAHEAVAPPFRYSGNDANGAVIVKDASGQLKVAYVYRYPPDVLPAAQQAMLKGQPSPTDIEVLKPGTTTWLRKKDVSNIPIRGPGDMERRDKVNAEFNAIVASPGARISPE